MCSTPLESPLLNFNPEQSPPPNLFLGLEWPSVVPQLSFQSAMDQTIDSNIGDTVLIGDRIAGIQANLIADGILLGDEHHHLNLIHDSQHDEIGIDPDLLTLKPTRECLPNDER